MNPKTSKTSTKVVENVNKPGPSTDHRRTPRLARHPPVYTFHQHRKLRPAQADLAVRGRGPHKPPPLKSLGEQTGPLAIPPTARQGMFTCPRGGSS